MVDARVRGVCRYRVYPTPAHRVLLMEASGHPGRWERVARTATDVARWQGPALGDNIIAALRGAETKPFVFTALGTMASLGGRRGVVAFPNGFILTGFIAWFVWRTYYLLRLPGLDRRLRVAFDWMLDLFFSRDIAELRVYTERDPSRPR